MSNYRIKNWIKRWLLFSVLISVISGYCQVVDIDFNKSQIQDTNSNKDEDSINIENCKNLGRLYSENGDYLKELGNKQIVCDYYIKTLGEKSSEYIISLANLAIAYSHLGQYKKSLLLKKKAELLLQQDIKETY